MRFLFFSFLFFVVLFPVSSAQAGNAFAMYETPLRVTVRAQDAKFIGTSMGGAHITITNKMNGDILAEGITSGGTGDTALIMAESHKRDAILVDESVASYDVSIVLLEPTLVTITARAPLAQMQSMVSVSRDMVLLPGKDYVSENGILIEMPGMAVDILDPPAASKIPFDLREPLFISANIVKLCGCHIAPGGPWPLERYEVEARMYKGDQFITAMPLGYAEKPGQFAAKIKMPLAGTYKVVVTAFDKHTKEAGMDSTTVILVEK